MSLNAKMKEAIKNIAAKHKDKMVKKIKPKKEVKKIGDDGGDNT